MFRLPMPKLLTVKLAVTRRRRRRLQIMIGLWWYDPSRPTALWDAGRRRVWAPLTSRPISPSGSDKPDPKLLVWWQEGILLMVTP